MSTVVPTPAACPRCGKAPAKGSRLGLCTACMVQLVLAPLPSEEEMPAPESAQRDASIYDLEGEVARGGMGSIVRARDRTLGRTVAMKVMLPKRGAAAESRQRFNREAQVLARLEHPNIVPIHDLGVDGQGRAFYTMKLVQGLTLQEVLDKLADGDKATVAKYPLNELLNAVLKVCDAVAFAHSRGILHRDLKPQNIMVGEFGEVLVMDWGLAKVMGESADDSAASPMEYSTPSAADTQLTMEGAVMGSPHYMSPEQAEGRMAELDERSDVYALGGILYTLLTLHPPVVGGNVEELLGKLKRGEIDPPSSFNTRSQEAVRLREHRAPKFPGRRIALPHLPGGLVPEALSSVAMKALAVNREQRYPSVAALVAEITAHQGGFATGAENAGLFTQLRLLVQRHKILAGSAALIVVLTIGFVIKVISSEQKATAHARTAEQNEGKAKAETERATKAEFTTKAALVKSALALAEAGLREGNGPVMQAALKDVPENLRDSTWRYLRDESDTSIFARTGNWFENVAAHPRRPGVFAATGSSRTVSLLDVRTGTRLLEFAPGFKKIDAKLRLAFSPDGERIAVGQEGGSGGIVIHSARDGKKLAGWDAPATMRLEFSPDGKWLLQSGRSVFRVWNTATGQTLKGFERVAGFATAAFTPDGQQVLVHSTNPSELWLVNAKDGKRVRSFSNLNPSSAFAIRPDGRTVVIGTSDGKVQMLSLNDGRVLFEIRPPANTTLQHLAFTPGGANFVSVAGRVDGGQDIRLWDANTGAPVQALLGGTGPIRDASVHPLSGELLVGGRNARAWNLTGTPAKWILPGNGADPSIAFWGSDDRVIAPARETSGALLDLSTGSPVILWNPDVGGFHRPSVSADGRFAAVIQTKVKAPIALFRNFGEQAEQVATFKPSFSPQLLRLSPTGDRLAVIVGINRWDLELINTVSGTRQVSLERKDIKSINDVAWLGVGDRLVGLVTGKNRRGNANAEERVVLWDSATGKILQTATNFTAMDVLVIAPDGQHFAEAGVDMMVRIRDAATLAVQQEFRAHNGPITALAWHPTKSILATASADLSIRLWNLDTGRRLEELRGPTAAPHTLVFSPSGRRLGCSARDGVTRIWEPPSLNDQSATE